MSKKWNEMKFDAGQDCWVVNLRGQWYGLHCGEHFEIVLGGRNIPCRLELDLEWYIIMLDVTFYLRNRDTYKIII